MKKILVLALLAVACVASMASAKVVGITNGTAIVVMEVFLSHSGTDDWEEDMLGSGTLKPGETLQVDISGPALWDIKLVGENAAEAVFTEIDFNKYTVITLHNDGNATGK